MTSEMFRRFPKPEKKTPKNRVLRRPAEVGKATYLSSKSRASKSIRNRPHNSETLMNLHKQEKLKSTLILSFSDVP